MRTRPARDGFFQNPRAPASARAYVAPCFRSLCCVRSPHAPCNRLCRRSSQPRRLLLPPPCHLLPHLPPQPPVRGSRRDPADRDPQPDGRAFDPRASRGWQRQASRLRALHRLDAKWPSTKPIDAVTWGQGPVVAASVSTRERCEQSAKLRNRFAPAMGPRAPTVPCDTRFDMSEPSVESQARELNPRDSAFLVSRLVGLFGSER